jgi:hypothetical protein
MMIFDVCFMKYKKKKNSVAAAETPATLATISSMPLAL